MANELQEMKQMLIDQDFAIKVAIESALGASKNINILQKFYIEEYCDMDLTGLDEDAIVEIYNLIENINEILVIFSGRADTAFKATTDLQNQCWSLIQKNGYNLEEIMDKRFEINPDALSPFNTKNLKNENGDH